MINRLAILLFKIFLYPMAYLRKREARPAVYKNILLVNTTGIGDTILSTPAWQALREKFPSSTITLMVHEKRKDVAAYNPLVNNIITYRKFLYFFKLIRKLRSLHIDAAIIFHGNDPDILPLVFLARPGEIIGYKKRTRLPYLLTRPVLELPSHFITSQMKLAEVIAGQLGTYPTVFYLTQEEKNKADIFIEEKGLKGKTTIGVLPGAGRPYKRWPGQRFGALISNFLKKADTAVIIFGSEREKRLTQEVEGAVSNAMKANIVNTAGLFNLRETAAVINSLNLFLTNDSGPLHIAMALNVPAVGLFCPTDPKGLLPAGTNTRLRIIKKDVPCERCITKKCKASVCMEQISVEEVISACNELLSQHHKYKYAAPSQ